MTLIMLPYSSSVPNLLRVYSYHQTMLNLSHTFSEFCDHMIFIIYYMIYHMFGFLYIEWSMLAWVKYCLIMVNDSCNMLVNFFFFCWNFVKNLSVYWEHSMNRTQSRTWLMVAIAMFYGYFRIYNQISQWIYPHGTDRHLSVNPRSEEVSQIASERDWNLDIRVISGIAVTLSMMGLPLETQEEMSKKRKG